MERKKKQTIYISGKISEDVISEETRVKFGAAEQMLRSRGFKVLNPAGKEFQEYIAAHLQINDSYIRSTHISRYSYTLMLCIGELSLCDGIFLLGDYFESPGAQAELAFAAATGMPIYRDDEFFAPYIDSNKELPFQVRRTYTARRLPKPEKGGEQ